MKLLFRQSLKCAIFGIIFCLINERNFRIHLIILLTLILFCAVYGVCNFEAAVLSLAVGTVLSAELFNTAVEKVVDLFGRENNFLAKISKDIAAGGVLISAITSVFVAFFIFNDPERLGRVFRFVFGSVVNSVLFALYSCCCFALCRFRNGKIDGKQFNFK